MSLLLDRIEKRDVCVGVIGLGYVGLPLSLVFAQGGAKVLGIDSDDFKAKSINQGKSYLQHIPDAQVAEQVQAQRLSATSDITQVKDCDAVIICVPTPLNQNLEPDLQYIEQTCTTLAPHLKKGCIVILESTTWPGTTEEVVGPLIEKHSSLKLSEDFHLAFSPEREDPGNEDFGTRNVPKLVGATEAEGLKIAEALYKIAVDDVVPVSSTQVAESAKLLENIFRSVNIALVNELKMILDRMGIDVWEVIAAASTKPFGFMPFYPGPGLGGSCIPIDPFYLAWKAKEHGITTRFIELAGEINRHMPRWVVRKTQDVLNDYAKPFKGSRILILGMAYKSDVGDIRESPSRELMVLLEAKGATVHYHDPLIPEIGSSRRYGQLEGRKSQPLSPDYDCFVLATMHSSFSVDEILAQGVPVLDTRNALPKHQLVRKA